MSDKEKLSAIGDVIVRWVNEPYAEVGNGHVGPSERKYLEEILDILSRQEVPS